MKRARPLRIIVFGSLMLVALLGQVGTTLTFRQIEALIEIGQPDRALAGEIVDRGLAQPITATEFEALKQTGAGPLTLAALVPFVTPVRITISTSPLAANAEVSMGTRRYHTDERGQIVISNLERGQHNAVLRHDLFQNRIFGIDVGLTDVRLTLDLTPIKGYLSVHVSFAEATVRVSKTIVSVDQGVSSLPLNPGGYLVEVTTPYHKPWSEEVSIMPGRETSISPLLVPDPVAGDRLKSEVRRLGEAPVTPRFQALVEAWRLLEPTEPEPLVRFTKALFASNQHDQAVAIGTDALGLGGVLSFTVKHYHTSGFETHFATITMAAAGFSYSAWSTYGPAACDVSIVYLPLSHMGQTRELGTSGSSLLAITLTDPRNPNRQMVLNLLDEHSPLGSRGATSNRPSSDGQRALHTIARLLSVAKPKPIEVAVLATSLPNPKNPDRPVLVMGTRVIDTERVRGRTRIRNAITEVSVPGSRSRVAVPPGETVLLLRPGSIAPETYYLYRMEQQANTRVLSFGMPEVQFPQTVPLHFERSGLVYRLTPGRPLTPGEYCISALGVDDAYCFSVRAPR